MVLKRRKKPVKEMQMVKVPSNLWKSRKPKIRNKEEARLSYKKSAEIDPFEAKGYTSRYGYRTLLKTKCNDRSPCPPLVLLYYRMGLHRHNLLKGTNYELVCVRKYNKTILFAVLPRTTLLRLPRIHLPLLLSFSTLELMNKLMADVFSPAIVLDLELKKSEWQDNAWISLYLELAVATTHWDRDLSNLKIVKVAMDTTEDVNEERLNAKNVVFYIRYKDSCEARVGKNVDRIAVVKRAFNERTGCFSLVGQNLSSEIIPKNDKIRSVQSAIRKSKDSKSYRCYGVDKEEGLIYVKRYGIPKENPKIKKFRCCIPRRVCENTKKYKVKDVFRYKILQDALIRLKINPSPIMMSLKPGQGIL